MYNDKSAVNNAVVYVFPALGGFLVLEIVRNLVISRLVTISADETLGTVAAYVNDYYIGSRLFFNWSWLIIFTIATCAAILLRPVNKINVKSKIVLEVAVFSVVVSVVSVIYWLNPPALFGYLTTDNTICDMTEEAFAWYLIRYVVTLVFVFVLIALTVNDKLDIRITGIVMAAAFIAGLVFIIIAYNVKGMLSFMYAACVLADVIGAVVLVALLVAGTFNVKEDK